MKAGYGLHVHFTGSSVGLTIPWRDVERFEEALKEFTAFEVIKFWYGDDWWMAGWFLLR